MARARFVALLVGAVALLGVAGAATTARALDSDAGTPVAALRAAVTTVPDVAALPPAVADRMVEAVTDRSTPRTPGPDGLLFAGTTALAAAVAHATATRRRPVRPVGIPIGPGSTRAPPVTR